MADWAQDLEEAVAQDPAAGDRPGGDHELPRLDAHFSPAVGQVLALEGPRAPGQSVRGEADRPQTRADAAARLDRPLEITRRLAGRPMVVRPAGLPAEAAADVAAAAPKAVQHGQRQVLDRQVEPSRAGLEGRAARTFRSLHLGRAHSQIGFDPRESGLEVRPVDWEGVVTAPLGPALLRYREMDRVIDDGAAAEHARLQH